MIQSVLKKAHLFSNLPEGDLDLIAHAARLDTLEPGAVVFSEGDESKAMFVIKYGSVRIRQEGTSGDGVAVATLATGAHFGEMAFLDGAKRSAAAEAVEKTEVVRIDYDKLRAEFEKHPQTAANFYRTLALFLANRLRNTTADLRHARERIMQHL